MENKKLTVILSYVSLPATTAIYFENALRTKHNVITTGYTITEEAAKANKIDLEVKDLDIPITLDFDFAELFSAFPKYDIKPDLFLLIESAFCYTPINIDKLDVPTACYLIDTHLSLEHHLEIAKKFDFVFIAQKEYLSNFLDAGLKNVYWLPLGCDPEVHIKTVIAKDREIGFVGSFVNNPRRTELLDKLKSNFDVKIKRCFYEEMAMEFSKSKIIFNNAVKNDLNMRVFEALSTGSFLLTDEAANSGLRELFVDGEDLAIYNDEHINNVAEFYLENEELRETIAARGREICHNAHTYMHRCDEIVNIMTGKKSETPSVNDWRELSIQDTSVTSKEINKLKRSFIIPVLDYSPNSDYSIKTLLDDLDNIEGNVIVIFNSKEVAEDLKNHPRIDYYSIMSHNLGVARAWNIGLDMVQTPITFILNSDLQITKESVEELETSLISLPDAAIVGPQGSFNNFFALNDHMQFVKGDFDQPIEIDAVSGFYFAVKTKYFHNGTLKFENHFTPCYYEEWDLGLQIKRAGLKSYIVPTKGFNHEFGGSIKSLKKINYLNKEITLSEVHEKNAAYFHKKWLNINKDLELQGINDLLISKIIKNELDQILFNSKYSKEAKVNSLQFIISHYKDFNQAILILGKIFKEYKLNDIALEFFNQILKNDPNCEEAILEKKELRM